MKITHLGVRIKIAFVGIVLLFFDSVKYFALFSNSCCVRECVCSYSCKSLLAIT